LGSLVHFQGGRFLANCAAMSHGDPVQSGAPGPAAFPAARTAGAANGASVTAAVAGQDATGSNREETAALPAEIGGRGGPEPTRYGDWEKAGRCIDF
jgi:hypothetical protein